MDQVLDALANDAFLVCEELGLQAKRALACTCSALRAVIFQLLRQLKLVVQESDGIWDNVRFVANVLVPNVPKQVLCVAGETYVPEMKLAHLRTLPKLKVGAMGPTAALFFGAAIADSDCVLRLSTGATKSIRALRENDRINLQMPEISQPSDRNAMLGALTLNAGQGVAVLTSRTWLPSNVAVAFFCLAFSVRPAALAEMHNLELGSAGVCDAGMLFLVPTLRHPHCMLSKIDLGDNLFSDKGLIALAPALRQLLALTTLNLANNRFGDEGLAALVLPPLPVCALPTTTGVLLRLQRLNLRNNQVTDAGCAILAAALDSGALPALEEHSCDIEGIPASAAAKVAVYKALAASRRGWRQRRAAAA